MIHEFRLSPPGKGVSCGAEGAFVGAVPLLKRSQQDGGNEWQPRDCEALAEQLSAQYGLPIDMSAKRAGLRAIANALNEGDVARAQIVTVLLGIPDPPQLAKGDCSRDQTIRLIRDLHWSSLLKWDPDEHPRWPAGTADSKGGQFAPKGEGSETDGSLSAQSAATHSYNSEQYVPDQSARIRIADAEMSDAFDDPIAEAARAAARRERASTEDANSAATEFNLGDGSSPTQINSGRTAIPEFDSGDQPVIVDGNTPYTDDNGIYADYGRHIGGTQFAAATIPMGSLGITRANPANWENLARLTNGSLELGTGQIITAAALLSALDQSREHDAVWSAITKFGLNPKQAADILAARAYVWSNTAAPWNFAGVPTSGPGLESVSRSIALLELARPGTLYLAWQGDQLSTDYLKAAAQEGLSDTAILESRRLANAPLALQSWNEAARARLKLKSGDNMQAHHLVPVNIIGRNLPLATLASEAGWRTDSPENLIALPADPQTQEDLAAATGRLLPMQRSAHPVYDGQTQKQIDALKLVAGSPLTPMKARSILDKVAAENLRQILSGEWDPMLKSS